MSDILSIARLQSGAVELNAWDVDGLDLVKVTLSEDDWNRAIGLRKGKMILLTPITVADVTTKEQGHD